MHRETLIAIGAGLASALLSIAVAYGSGIGLLLAYFALLPILLIGLSQGPRFATIAALSGVIGAIFLTNISQGALFGISVALPAWLITRYALMTQTAQDGSLKWLQIGEVLSRLAALGGVVLVLSAITYFDAPGGLPKVIETFLDKMIAARFQFGAPADQHLLVERLVPFFPAITVSSWVLMTIINSVLAQAILIRAGINLRPAVQFSRIAVPEWIYWGIVGAGTLALIGSGTFEYVGRNLAIVLAIPFFLVGLAVVHTLVRQLRSPGIALSAFYFFMVISSWAIFVAAVIGFFENWNQLRQKFPAKKQKSDDEDA
jgi:hypothetical protein